MIQTITREELKSQVDRGERLALLDVRRPESYNKGHLPGAVNIPLNEVESRAGELCEKNDPIVVYCGSFDCTLSPQAARILSELRFENVTEFSGGFAHWREAGYPVETSLAA